MTIAVCYLSPEGVVLGADSTTTLSAPTGRRYYNHGQKLFEIGKDSTLGVVTWGLGGLDVSSYRMLFAVLADDLNATKPKSMREVADRWINQFHPAYLASSVIKQFAPLHAKTPFVPNVAPQPNARTENEERAYRRGLIELMAGFCIAGYVAPNRTPQACRITFEPIGAKPAPIDVPMNGIEFNGAPNMIHRLLGGYDPKLREDLLQQNRWQGTPAELDAFLRQYHLGSMPLPIRDAIDYVHSCILSTIKALKFSRLAQICGGPIEIAVITADRNFRWVKHKAFDSAITEGETP